MKKTTPQHEITSKDHVQTFVIHLFRSETGREIALRHRLDVTTSGAVVVTSGLISFSFSSPGVSHAILLANVLALFVFLLVESRRYRVHASLMQRVRSIEKTYIAPLLNQIASQPADIDYEPHIDAAVISDMLEHKAPINRFKSILLRLRSIYIYLLAGTYIFWLHKILSNRVDQTWLDHIDKTAQVGLVSGIVVFFLFSAVMLTALILSLYMSRTDDYF